MSCNRCGNAYSFGTNIFEHGETTFYLCDRCIEYVRGMEQSRLESDVQFWRRPAYESVESPQLVDMTKRLVDIKENKKRRNSNNDIVLN